MLTIALFEPEIPPNTGNIIRLAANTGARLALIEPLGFELTDVRLRRAGLDYRALATTTVYPDFARFSAAVGQRRLLAFSTRGMRRYDTVSYRDDDVLLFGPETRGLPEAILDAFPVDYRLRIPMHRHPDAKRAPSLNLGNAVSIALYEAWRQLDFS
ncbi:MAG: tRNA (cytidine(34)-2'-O)-methyltransferase [Gammaproteobacteria bacterium]|nr:tRNA (cytidine(34)-2'-O)-methyltransferase [Gammaproteobacteria bacterium]